jgi:hypothetical protein
VLPFFIAFFATPLFSIKYTAINSQHLLENSPENIWNQCFPVSKFASAKGSLLADVENQRGKLLT